MSIEKEIFMKSLINRDRLIPFGFTEEGNCYQYSEPFHDGHFSARVTVDERGSLKALVWDMDSDEEYLPVRIDTATGEFVSIIRREFTEILERIRARCTIPQSFLYPQANRIKELIKQKYGEEPDFPFKKLSDYGVFRYPDNQKWYALIMNIPFNKMFSGDSEEIIEIMNVKIKPQDRNTLLNTPGIFDCYHMNRNSWVSILLNETLSDERIMELVDVSRNLIMGNASVQTVSNIWIVPANPHYYDIDTAFLKKKGVSWKQSSAINKGDIVYMYVGAPVSAIRYKCIVTEPHIPYEYSDENLSMKYLMRMDVIQMYPPEYCTFAKLGEFGIKAVRGPRRVPANLDEYLNAYER